MGKRKRVVSLLLALCMLFGMMPNVSAAEYSGDAVVPGLSGILPEDVLILPRNTDWATLTAVWGVRVSFIDWDETLLKTELVPVTDTTPGSSSAPEDPERDGYTFTGWERFDTNDGPATLNSDGTVTGVNGPGPIVYIATYEQSGFGEIEVTKKSDLAPGETASLGQTITYTVTVTNTGTVPVYDILIVDELEGTVLADGESEEIECLDPGESVDVHYTYVVTEMDILSGSIYNYVTASGTDPSGNTVEDDGDTEDCSDMMISRIDVTKKSDVEDEAILGQTITYTITISNTGNLTIYNIEVEDQLPGAKLASGENGKIASLAPGDSADVHFTYVVTEADILNGSVYNEVAVTGTDPEGNPVEDSADVEDPTAPYFFVVHHAVHGDLEDTVDAIPMSAVDEDGLFDITKPLTGENAEYYDGVRAGYIYGGMYVGGHDSPAYEDEPETELCGKELQPEANKYYYMREVSEEFLQPRIVSVRRYMKDDHVERYLLTAVDADGADKQFYESYGFAYDVNSDEYDSYLSYGVVDKDDTEEIYDECVDTEPYDEYDPMQCLLYEFIDVYRDGVLETTYKPGTVFSSRAGFEHITDGDYFGCVPYWADYADAGIMETADGEFAYTFHYTPFYVTADGVFVSGIYERYSNIEDADERTEAVNADFKLEGGSVTYSCHSAPVFAMAVAARFTADPDLLPEQEQIPETAEVTVTIHANGETGTVTGKAGDLTEAVQAPSFNGLRFVGWYADEDFETPADLSDVTGDTDVYARYVNDAYFTVQIINTVSKKVVTKSRIVTVVDDFDYYRETGLEITIDGEKTVYALNKGCASVNGYSPVKLYGSSVDKRSRLIYQDIKLTGLADGTEIVIVPYCVTGDGSRVYGKSRSMIYRVDHVE